MGVRGASSNPVLSILQNKQSLCMDWGFKAVLAGAGVDNAGPVSELVGWCACGCLSSTNSPKQDQIDLNLLVMDLLFGLFWENNFRYHIN